MKKRVLVIVLFSMLLVCGAMLISCKKDKNPSYFSLTLNQSVGGTINYVLDEGSKKDGKYLSGSILLINVTADNGYEFVNMKVGGSTVTALSYRFAITSNIVVSATYKINFTAATVMERIESAFFNTYDLDGYNNADGITGRVIQQIKDQDEMVYNVTTDFSFAKNSADTYLCTEIKYGKLPMISFYYFDSETIGDATLYLSIMDVQKYYAKVTTIGEIFDVLYADVSDAPSSGTGNNSEYLSIDLLEMLGVVYGVDNAVTSSSFTIDITILLDLIVEMFSVEMEGLDTSFLHNMPQIDFTIFVNYITVLNKEQFGDVGYYLTVGNTEFMANGELIKIGSFSLRGKLEMEFSLWRGIAPKYELDTEGAEEIKFIEIFDVILSVIEMFS